LTKGYIKNRASQWLNELIDNAKKMEMENNIKLEKRYISLALDISKHYKVKLPNKEYICKKCKSYLIPGRNASIRVRKGRVIIKCLRCGNVKRFKIK